MNYRKPDAKRRLLPALSLCLLSIGFHACRQAVDTNPENWTTPYEEMGGQKSPAYPEVIAYYLELSKAFPSVNIQTLGSTDSGEPLHLVTFNPDGNFNFQKIGEEKAIILLNNGIHPGESDGIDASMMLFRDLATGQIEAPMNTVIACIPVYNIGGALNRNSTSRVNQNGPEEYGFRGNARNYDLNRDFIKSDTKNAQTFAFIFHLVKPDFFIDTHVSNGADYQYVLTHLFTQYDKLGGEAGFYLKQTFVPMLEQSLEQKGLDITPYVNVYNRPPDEGFDQFLDNPRYSTGYTALWGSLGLMIETHMLKPYETRVEQTYALLQQLVRQVDQDYDQIKEVRHKSQQEWAQRSHYPLGWVVDTSSFSTRLFKGYEVDTIPSEITGSPRLKYNQQQPFTKEIPFYDRFIPSDSVAIPAGYILPAAYAKIVQLFQGNQVEMYPIAEDTLIQATHYRIENYQTRRNAYEGHYLHYGTQVSSFTDSKRVKKGDYWIPISPKSMRYILECLEPEAVDSFFNWNYFDPILQQKEGFSAYVFEDLAIELLAKDADLKSNFEQKKNEDPKFAQNAYAQLNWIFRNSEHYEKAHNRYPVIRVEKESKHLSYLKGLEEN